MMTLPPPPGDPAPARSDVAASLRAAWDDAAEDITATAILLARRGDIQALKLILERIAPSRGRLLALDIPRIESVANVPDAQRRLVMLVSTGVLTVEEAGGMSDILQNYVSAVAAVEHEQRLAAIEQALKESRDGH